MTLFLALMLVLVLVLVPVPGPEPRRDFVGVPSLIFLGAVRVCSTTAQVIPCQDSKSSNGIKPIGQVKK